MSFASISPPSSSCLSARTLECRESVRCFDALEETVKVSKMAQVSYQHCFGLEILAKPLV